MGTALEQVLLRLAIKSKKLQGVLRFQRGSSRMQAKPTYLWSPADVT